MANQYQDITVQAGMTLYDVSMRYYGSLGHARAIAKINELPFGIETDLRAGQVLKVERSPGITSAERANVNFFMSAGVTVNTGGHALSQYNNCVFEAECFEPGVFDCEVEAGFDLVGFMRDKLDTLGILDQFLTKTEVGLVLSFDPGQHSRTIYAQSTDASEVLSVSGYNVESYWIYINEVLQPSTFSIAGGDEIRVEILPTDVSSLSELTLIGTY